MKRKGEKNTPVNTDISKHELNVQLDTIQFQAADCTGTNHQIHNNRTNSHKNAHKCESAIQHRTVLIFSPFIPSYHQQAKPRFGPNALPQLNQKVIKIKNKSLEGFRKPPESNPVHLPQILGLQEWISRNGSPKY